MEGSGDSKNEEDIDSKTLRMWFRNHVLGNGLHSCTMHGYEIMVNSSTESWLACFFIYFFISFPLNGINPSSSLSFFFLFFSLFLFFLLFLLSLLLSIKWISITSLSVVFFPSFFSRCTLAFSSFLNIYFGSPLRSTKDVSLFSCLFFPSVKIHKAEIVSWDSGPDSLVNLHFFLFPPPHLFLPGTVWFSNYVHCDLICMNKQSMELVCNDLRKVCRQDSLA